MHKRLYDLTKPLAVGYGLHANKIRISNLVVMTICVIFKLCKNFLLFIYLFIFLLCKLVSLWLQRLGMGQSFPWVLDSALCTGVILHGIFTSNPQFNSFLVSFRPIRNLEVRMHFLYLLAGYYSYLSSLALAPYREFYVMAAVGYISIGLTLLQRWNRDKGDAHFGSRKHSHRH